MGFGVNYSEGTLTVTVVQHGFSILYVVMRAMPIF